MCSISCKVDDTIECLFDSDTETEANLSSCSQIESEDESETIVQPIYARRRVRTRGGRGMMVGKDIPNGNTSHGLEKELESIDKEPSIHRYITFIFLFL